MNFCSSLMMLWQELESSARKICLENHTVETDDCIPAEAIFDRSAPGAVKGAIRDRSNPVFRWGQGIKVVLRRIVRVISSRCPGC